MRLKSYTGKVLVYIERKCRQVTKNLHRENEADRQCHLLLCYFESWSVIISIGNNNIQNWIKMSIVVIWKVGSRQKDSKRISINASETAELTKHTLTPASPNRSHSPFHIQRLLAISFVFSRTLPCWRFGRGCWRGQIWSCFGSSLFVILQLQWQ